MGHIKFDKGNNKKRNLNGFYLALAICLVAVGGVAVATFFSSMSIQNKPSDNGSQVITTTKKSNPTQPVGHIVTNVPEDRTKTTESATASKTATQPTKEADLFILPLSNEVICGYSDNQPVYSKTMNDWRVHNGVDFKGGKNQQVKALADGTIVSFTKKDTLWGGVVVIDHGYGIQSRYCGIVPASTLKVSDTVKVGDVIGALSEVPCESEDSPHLHIEILVNGEYVNPIEAIGREVKYSTTATSN